MYIYVYICYILLDGRESPSSAVLYAGFAYGFFSPTEDSFTGSKSRPGLATSSTGLS